MKFFLLFLFASTFAFSADSIFQFVYFPILNDAFDFFFSLIFMFALAGKMLGILYSVVKMLR